MTNPYLIAPSFDAVPHKIDEIRWTWAGDLLMQLGETNAAARCHGFAAEHRMTADRLEGKVAIGAGEDDPEVTADAIAFGGPLPVKGAA